MLVDFVVIISFTRSHRGRLSCNNFDKLLGVYRAKSLHRSDATMLRIAARLAKRVRRNDEGFFFVFCSGQDQRPRYSGALYVSRSNK